jgi:hypothetical protein
MAAREAYRSDTARALSESGDLALADLGLEE